ncbi:MAG: helix-turn-helix transcriptional regulator [Prolixibacteraceae bacterium]|jgi:AraC family transcriptional regulator, arabinose operon regulatory protein|nr:helix-turn-helix transcriptional regulator [Prolixibacteraceae bacterium]MBT6006705.1 helix-turn-helix transcriptional regulator [Prolixibacteraceae bacterium]MBT6764288.1 helix-turn-helix transcriptional regulator [Prolixibacteraceae bacterium]MBT6999340.1 helix-turn-helix transcriptional regulator [Prolixibacteraceae bacterium]MBT7395437.1 helix-turn-helix transcriptional regulator [Prolixibacteraceae bacterium]
MITETRYFKIPVPLIDGQKKNSFTKDLFLTETGEIEVEQGTIWGTNKKLESYLLVYCTKGNGIALILDEQVPVSNDQFFIISKGDEFKFYSVPDVNTHFLIAWFDGKKAKQLGKEFSVVRNLIPSVNNMVANREMLFDEIFNNLSKGFHDENLEYVNFCFGHLLATFIYANKTSDDIADESNPLIRRAINYLGKNLNRKLSLNQIADEVGYSPTYFTTLFKKETNYSPISYFSHLKIVKACELLDYTQMKVKEVSFHLGYSDPYYFTKDFKKKMGLSPRNYRNRVN